MKYLVDTHIFLWWLNDDKRLKTSIKEILKSRDNSIYASVVTAWELSIKFTKNSTFRLKTTIEDCFQKAGFDILDVKFSHILHLQKLEQHHKDPFDRMLIAQTVSENAILITGDEKIWKYDVEVLKT